MAIQKFLALIAGKTKEILGIDVSAGAGDAGKIAVLGADGRWDSSMMAAGFGAETILVVASEAIAAGDFVNLYVNAGVINMRKADASNAAKEANGYVLAAVASAASGTVYYGNLNTQQTGLTVGDTLYLSHTVPGKATSVVPTGVGKIVQRLGKARTATEILVEIGETVELAS